MCVHVYYIMHVNRYIMAATIMCVHCIVGEVKLVGGCVVVINDDIIQLRG